MASKDWKTTIQDSLDRLAERLREWADAIADLGAPPPELVPIPVRPEDNRPRR